MEVDEQQNMSAAQATNPTQEESKVPGLAAGVVDVSRSHTHTFIA